MRKAKEGEYLVGKVCVCSLGRIAVVTGRKTYDGEESWVGLGLDGKGNWSSRGPHVIAESGQEYYDKLAELHDKMLKSRKKLDVEFDEGLSSVLALSSDESEVQGG